MNKRVLFRIFIFLYLFIFSIELIKKLTMILSKDLISWFNFIDTPLKSFSFGWLFTSIVQSGGGIIIILATFTGLGVINFVTGFYSMLGTRIGITITPLLMSLFVKNVKRRDFRHGFEISLVHTFYNLSLVILFFFLEYFFSVFSKIGLIVSDRMSDSFLVTSFPNLINLFFDWLVDIFLLFENKILLLIFALILLLISLEFISKYLLKLYDGEQKTRKIINSCFRSKSVCFFTGLISTFLLTSTNITITLLVPLAVKRVINLKKAIPFIIGANVGTVLEVVILTLIAGKSLAIALVFVYVLFALIGVLIWLPNTNLLFKITKYFSKRMMHVSRERALMYFVVFILIPFFILIFS